MQLTVNRAPMSSGVTQLMYVGDDEAVETAVAPAKPTPKELAIGARRSASSKSMSATRTTSARPGTGSFLNAPGLPSLSLIPGFTGKKHVHWTPIVHQSHFAFGLR